MRNELRCVRERPEERVQYHEPVEVLEVKHVDLRQERHFCQKRHLRQERHFRRSVICVRSAK